MHDFDRHEQTGLPVSNVLFNGAAANAQKAANILQRIGEDGKIFHSTHPTDIVGKWIGRNPATGKKTGGKFPPSHSSYTGYLPPLGTSIKVGETGKNVDLRKITDKHWGSGGFSIPVYVAPKAPKKKEKSDGEG